MTQKTDEIKREHWGSRIGLILAMAGNALGLGNFLRFPVQAAANGGGAFMIPYFIALIFLGIPLMWIEWGLGRYGGSLGHGTMPGVIQKITKNRYAKYLGVLGVILPLLLVVYYNYIESWTLSFSYFSITGKFQEISGNSLADKKHEMGRFFKEFQGIRPKVKIKNGISPEDERMILEAKVLSDLPPNVCYESNSETNNTSAKENDKKADLPYREVFLKGKYFSNNATAYIFFLITFILNFYFLYKGLAGGIEKLAKIGMPLLFVMAIILMIRVLTLGRPEGSSWSVADGFNFLWKPNFSELYSAKVWLAAAGQIFFTLSLGLGAIQTYASYLTSKDDIVLSGLTTASLNEFAEVILGGTIAIPVAVAFFGPDMTVAIAKGGAFDLGFQALPMIFSQISFGWFFGAIWFFLLFIAGITSSVALLTPAIAFLKDEMKLTHEKAVFFVGLISFGFSHGCIFFIEHGVVDEMDFWVGTFGLVVLALIEVILFMWVFGGNNAWKEMHKGCDVKIPEVFYFIMKYITPVYILGLLFAWGFQDGWSILTMANNPASIHPYIFATRVGMLAVTGLFLHLIWLRFGKEDTDSIAVPIALWTIPIGFLAIAYPGMFPMNSNGLIFLIFSWTFAFSLCLFCVYKMLHVPSKRHNDFPEESITESVVK